MKRLKSRLIAFFNLLDSLILKGVHAISIKLVEPGELNFGPAKRRLVLNSWLFIISAGVISLIRNDLLYLPYGFLAGFIATQLDNRLLNKESASKPIIKAINFYLIALGIALFLVTVYLCFKKPLLAADSFALSFALVYFFLAFNTSRLGEIGSKIDQSNQQPIEV